MHVMHFIGGDKAAWALLHKDQDLDEDGNPLADDLESDLEL